MKNFSHLLIGCMSAFIISAASLSPVGASCAEEGAERTPDFRAAEDGSDCTAIGRPG